MTETDGSGSGELSKTIVAELLHDGLETRKQLLAESKLEELEASFTDEALLAVLGGEGDVEELRSHYKAELLIYLAEQGQWMTCRTLMMLAWWKLFPVDWPLQAMGRKACEGGYITFLENFLKLGWAPDEDDLVAAAGHGQYRCVQWLMEKGKDIYTGPNYQAGMEAAALAGYGACVNLLVDMQGVSVGAELLQTLRMYEADRPRLPPGPVDRDWGVVLEYLDGK